MRKLCFLFSIFLLSLAFLTHTITLANGDVAEYLNNPLRILNGQLPYLDFWLLFPPGEVYLPSLIYRLFGTNINSVLLFNLVTQITLAVVAYLLVKRLTKITLYSYISAVLVFFHSINNFYLLPIITSAYLFLILPTRQKTFVSGLLLGFAYWFRFYEIAALTFAFTLFLTLTGRKRLLIPFLLGNLLPILILLISFKDLFFPMLDQVLVSSLKHGTTWSLPYFTDLQVHLRFLLSSSSLRAFIVIAIDTPWITGLYLLPLSVVLAAVTLLKSHPSLKPTPKNTVIFFLLWALVLFPRALRRGSLGDVAHPLLPIFLLSGLLISLPVPRLSKAFFYFSLLLSLWSVAALPYHQARLLLRQRYIISSPFGNLQTPDRQLALKYQNQINQALAVPASKPLFYTAWDSPPLYALTNRPNPTYYDSLIDLLAVPNQEKEMQLCRSITQTSPLIFHNPASGITDVNRHFYSFAELTPTLNSCLTNRSP